MSMEKFPPLSALSGNNRAETGGQPGRVQGALAVGVCVSATRCAPVQMPSLGAMNEMLKNPEVWAAGNGEGRRAHANGRQARDLMMKISKDSGACVLVNLCPGALFTCRRRRCLLFCCCCHELLCAVVAVELPLAVTVVAVLFAAGRQRVCCCCC